MVNKYYEVVVFTASYQWYADKILGEIKKHKMSITRLEFKIEPEKTNSKGLFSNLQAIKQTSTCILQIQNLVNGNG